MPVIGIDFGTSFSSVAIPIGGQIEVLRLPIEAASPSTNGSLPGIPSTVQFTACERLVGTDWSRTETNVQNRVFHIKRLMGRAKAAVVQMQQQSVWPFELDYVEERTVVNVMYRHVEREFAPEQLAAMVMERLRQMAEERLEGQPVTDVVLSCPASFNTCQREALINAARVARMRVVSLLNETTAAAITYRVEMECKTPQKLLVFDMGGGATNVSILSVNDEAFDVIASTGNNALGGEDFTNRLMNHFATEFMNKYGTDLRVNKQAMERLRQACDVAKCTLSVQPQAHISLNDLHEGIHFTSRITRPCFEQLCQSLFKRIQALLEFVLRESRLKVQEIDDVILLGGSSRIPQVQTIISDCCGGRTLNRLLSPEEAVVYGTGVFARNFEESKQTNGFDSKFRPCVTDVIAHSLGVEVNDDTFNPIVQRNRILPLKAYKTYTTAFLKQSTVRFNLLAGDYLLAKYDDDIGTIIISDLPPEAAGKIKICLAFHVDRNGILKISSSTTLPGYNVVKLNIQNPSVSLTEEEVEEMIEEGKKLLLEDQENRNLALVKQSLLEYVEKKRKQLLREFASGSVSDANHDMLQQKYNSVKQWVAENPACSKYRYKQKQAELDVLWDDVCNGHKELD